MEGPPQILGLPESGSKLYVIFPDWKSSIFCICSSEKYCFPPPFIVASLYKLANEYESIILGKFIGDPNRKLLL